MSENPTPDFDLSGGALCLDFANTWEDRGRSETDKVAGYADLVAFARAAGILDREQARGLESRARARPQAAEAVWTAAIDLREALYRLFSARAAGESASGEELALLNSWLERAAARLHLEPEGSGFAWAWHGLEASFEAAVYPIARSAAEFLTDEKLGRIRECDGERCTWLFIDSSRNRSRRWCSMETCGNRAKARRHYRRSRESTASR